MKPSQTSIWSVIVICWSLASGAFAEELFDRCKVISPPKVSASGFDARLECSVYDDHGYLHIYTLNTEYRYSTAGVPMDAAIALGLNMKATLEQAVLHNRKVEVGLESDRIVSARLGAPLN